MDRHHRRDSWLAKAALSCLLVGLCCAPSLALDPSLRLTQYSQRTWTREQGLPQNSVRAIAQTSDGYLWVGTEQGLARFDGVRFVPMRLAATDGRPDALIRTLYSGPEALWVGTASGLYRLTKGVFVEILTAKRYQPIDGRPFAASRRH